MLSIAQLIQLRSLQEAKQIKKKSGIVNFVRGASCFLEYMQKYLGMCTKTITILAENSIDSVMKGLIDALESLDDENALKLGTSKSNASKCRENPTLCTVVLTQSCRKLVLPLRKG